MSSLNAFLHPEKVDNKEIIVSERFKDNGKVVPFVIRPITQKENEALIKKYTRKNKKGEESFDKIAYNQALAAAAVVEPDLNNSELQGAYNVLGADKLLVEMLYVGEFAVLMQEVQALSGLDADINDDIDDAKNE